MKNLLPYEGFWSYTSTDNKLLGNRLSTLRTDVETELKRLVTDRDVNVWQDSLGISAGDGWRSRIDGAIRSCWFLIPIVTPRFFQSAECCREVRIFRDRERQLLRSDLIFPIEFIDTSHVSPHNIEDCDDPDVYAILKNRQWLKVRANDIDYPELELTPDRVRLFAELIAARLNSTVEAPPRQPGDPPPGPQPLDKRSPPAAPQPPDRRAPPPGPQPLVGWDPPPGPRPRRLRPTLAERFETFAENSAILNIFVISEAMGLALLFSADALGLSDVVDQASGKEVGFLFAPNWSIMYTVLFPAYNTLFCYIAARVRQILQAFYDHGIIVAPGGSPLEAETLWQNWREHLRAVSFSMWAIIYTAIIITVGQWYSDCYKPLKKISTVPIDWATISLQQPNLISTEQEMFFTAGAYFYMAFSLCVYLSVLLYIPTFMFYTRKLSAGSRDFQTVIKGSTLQNQFATLMQFMFFCTFLGLMCAYLLHLQSAYRLSSLKSISEYMFSGVRMLAGNASNDSGVTTINITSWWSSFLVAGVAVAGFAFACFFSRDAFVNSREFVVRHGGSSDWRARLELSEYQIEKIAQLTFIADVVPQFWIYVGIITCLCLAVLLPNHVEILILGVLAYLVRALYFFFAQRRRAVLSH